MPTPLQPYWSSTLQEDKNSNEDYLWKFIGEAALVPCPSPEHLGDAIHLGLVLCQLFTVLITSLYASLHQSSLFPFYIASYGPVAYPKEHFFFTFFFPMCEKQHREMKWTCSVNFPALALLHAWRHRIIRHMPDRSHLMLCSLQLIAFHQHLQSSSAYFLFQVPVCLSLQKELF